MSTYSARLLNDRQNGPTTTEVWRLAAYKGEGFSLQDNMALVMACQQLAPRSRDIQKTCTKGRMSVDEYWGRYIAILTDMPQYSPLLKQIRELAHTLESSRRMPECDISTCDLQVEADFLEKQSITLTFDRSRGLDAFCTELVSQLQLTNDTATNEIDVFDNEFDEFVRLEKMVQIQNSNRIRLVAV